MQTNNHGCWFNTVEHCWMWNDHLINCSDHCIIFNPGDKATQRFVEEINEQVTTSILTGVFFTIMMSSCENVIRVFYDIYFEFQRWHWKWEKSFELLPNENFPQFRVANPGSSSSSDSSLKLRFLFAQSLDISCKTGRRIFFCPLLLPVNLWSCQIIFLFSLPGQINGFSFFNHL